MNRLENNIEFLSDVELEKQIVELSVREKKATVELLRHLGELEIRKLYLELGYSSMYEYCTKKLKYSEGAACRRIYSARALRDNPQIAELVVTGELSLSNIATAYKSLKSQKTTLDEISGKSTREVEKTLALHSPVLKPKEVVKPLCVSVESLPLFSEAPSPKEERYQLSFSVTKEVYEKLTQAKERLSNQVTDLSLEGVLSKLLDNYLNKTYRQTTVKKPSRYIPKFLKEEIYKRDGGQCTFVSPDGTRCCERCFLQIDHIDPYALGGKSTKGNLRLLCSAHNQYEARKAFS